MDLNKHNQMKFKQHQKVYLGCYNATKHLGFFVRTDFKRLTKLIVKSYVLP